MARPMEMMLLGAGGGRKAAAEEGETIYAQID
jgi:hypothetical protein